MDGLVCLYLMPQSHSLQHSSLFSVINVENVITSDYLDKKFIILCHNFVPCKTAWSNMLHVAGYYSQIALPFFNYPQQLRFRGALHHRDKTSGEECIMYDFLSASLNPYSLLQRTKIYQGFVLLMGIISHHLQISGNFTLFNCSF